ncbi:MAG: hypothetical protein ACYTDV_21100 [Planctomycetota bacterium]
MASTTAHFARDKGFAAIREQNNVSAEYPRVIRQIEEYLRTARTVSRGYPKESPSWGCERRRTGYVK